MVTKSPFHYSSNFAVVVPMANEEKEFDLFIQELKKVFTYLKKGRCYLVIDTVSTDSTLKKARALSKKDRRFVTIWSPENKNIVDAYIKGYQVAYQKGHQIIIEMDAGLSHDPQALPMFLRVLQEGNECVFGSRFINGGSLHNSNLKRYLLSRGGTLLSNLFLGTSLSDMTSGYQGFHASVVKKFITYPFQSTAHFYQTELRYLLRTHKVIEVPIHYQFPSPRVSLNSISNSLEVLWYYFKLRLTGRSKIL